MFRLSLVSMFRFMGKICTRSTNGGHKPIRNCKTEFVRYWCQLHSTAFLILYFNTLNLFRALFKRFSFQIAAKLVDIQHRAANTEVIKTQPDVTSVTVLKVSAVYDVKVQLGTGEVNQYKLYLLFVQHVQYLRIA